MKYPIKKKIFLTLIIFTLFLFSPNMSSAQDGEIPNATGGGGGGAGGAGGASSLFVPTFETNPALTTVQTGLQKITSLFTTGINVQQLFEWAFEIAVEALRRQLLNMIVDQIVQWIQGGGEPKFITDWPGFFRDAIDQAGGRFLQQLGLGLFCSPYNLALRAAFIPIPQFSDRSSCTLSQIGVNIDNFLKDFNSGGWVAWNEMILKPQNNIYGAYLMAWDEYEREKSAAEKAAAAEAQAGNGFLSVKRCIRQHQETVGVNEETGEPIYQTVCDEYQISTPGAVVGELAGQALGSDIPYIISAKEFAVYTAAITNAVLNRMFAEGVGLLHMAFSSGVSSGGGGGGGGGTNAGASVAQSRCAPLLGTPAYTQCVNSVQSGQDIREFQKSYLIQIIDQDLTYQNQLLGAKQTTLIILNQSLDVLRQIEACRNSPQPDIALTQSGITTINTQIAAIQSDIIALQLKQQQIRNVTDLTQIPSLYAQVTGVVNPVGTQSLALAAQEETSQKNTLLSSYQGQLNLCLEERARQQQLQLQQQQLQAQQQ